jgi:uncharacterized protein (DUF433 family)
MPLQRITFDPNVLGGQACLRGLRIPVAAIVRCIACGMSRHEILRDYPDLEDLDITAALEYAATLTEDRVIPMA